jgi:hypothetical protein
VNITSVELRDFKGQTVRHDLTGLDLLTGPNGAGKSALLIAIEWAIMGTTEIGKANEAIAKLVGPLGGSVHVTLADGFWWERQLRVDSAGKASQKLTVNGSNGSLKAAEATLKEKVGSFAPMFRLGTFLDKSDEEKTKVVMGLGGAGEPDPDGIIFRGTELLRNDGAMGPLAASELAGLREKLKCLCTHARRSTVPGPSVTKPPKPPSRSARPSSTSPARLARRRTSRLSSRRPRENATSRRRYSPRNAVPIRAVSR